MESKKHDWSEDEDFVSELDERVKRYESGEDAGCSWAELEAAITNLKKAAIE